MGLALRTLLVAGCGPVRPRGSAVASMRPRIHFVTQHRIANVSRVLGLLVVLGASPVSAQPDYPDPERYTLNWSARMINGFGATIGSLDRDFILENGIRADFLWGKPGDEHFRIGPAVDLRTAGFHSVEAGAGGSILLPVFRGYPIVLTVTAGYALRRASLGGDGFFLSNTVAWGYRSYNWHSRYGVGFNAFVSTRHHLDQRQAVEVTGGIELDVELAIGIPARALIMLFRGRDPDEPEDDEGEVEEGESPETASTHGPRRIQPARAIAF